MRWVGQAAVGKADDLVPGGESGVHLLSVLGCQLVGNQRPRHEPQSFQKLMEEPGGGLGITPGRDQDVQHDTVLVDSTPQVVVLPLDLDEHLV